MNRQWDKKKKIGRTYMKSLISTLDVKIEDALGLVIICYLVSFNILIGVSWYKGN